MSLLFRRMTRSVLRVHDAIVTLGYWLGATALALIVAMYAYEVFSRYLLGAPTKWASDFVSFLLLISVFMLLPHVTRIEGNVTVSVLLDVMGKQASDIVRRLGYGIGAAVCLWAGYIFAGEMDRLLARGTVTLTTIQFPKWILFGFLLFGMVNAGLCFLRLALGEKTNEVAK